MDTVTTTFTTQFEMEVEVDQYTHWVTLTVVAKVSLTPGVFEPGKVSAEDVRKMEIQSLKVDEVGWNGPPQEDSVILAAISSRQLFDILWDEWQIENFND